MSERDARAPRESVIVSTLLSLLVVPAFYVSTDRGLERVRRMFAKAKTQAAE